jgi:F-type H+-transporting ATPase subunit epsilon
MAATLTLRIVTPEGVAYETDAEYVVLPGKEGELGIYPGHTPLVTSLKIGELRCRHAGHETVLALGEGFAEITNSKISILTDSAVREEDMDEREIEAAIQRAQEALKEKLSEEEIAVTEASVARSTNMLHIKRKKRS